MCKISFPALEASLNGSPLKVDRKASIVYGGLLSPSAKIIYIGGSRNHRVLRIVS